LFNLELDELLLLASLVFLLCFWQI